jgi:phage terminase small subunit
MAAKQLTPKQRRFVEEYLIDLNATQAAHRAGYSGDTAYSIGHELLKKPEIVNAIGEAQARRSERTEITQDQVLQELALVAFADMGKYVTITDDGTVEVDFSHLPEGGLRVVSELVQDEYADGRGEGARQVKRTKLKLHNKLGALELVGKHLGMFVERVETGKPGQFDKLSPDQKRERFIQIARRIGIDRVAGNA